MQITEHGNVMLIMFDVQVTQTANLHYRKQR